MEYRLYVVYDKVAQEAGPVFVAKNDGIAVRQFLNLVKDTVEKNDYELRNVGFYDSELTIIRPDDDDWVVVSMIQEVEE